MQPVRFGCRTTDRWQLPICTVFSGLLVFSGLVSGDEDPDERAPAKIGLARNVVYAVHELPSRKEDGPRKYKKMLADVYEPAGPGPSPAALLIHGGSWTTGSKLQMAAHAKRLAHNGYVAVCINYRLAPRYKFPAQVDDCWKAYKWMVETADELGIDSANIATVGYSAGGHLACLLGTTRPADWGLNVTLPRVRAVVAGGSPCNLEILPPDKPILAHWLGGTRYQLPHLYRKASPLRAVDARDAPTFLFHGTEDVVVPDHLSKQMFARLEQVGVPVEYHPCEGKGHVRSFFDKEAAALYLAFLERNMKPQPAQAEQAAVPQRQ